MTEVRMIALKSWQNDQFEGNVRRDRPFTARDDRRADELERLGLAVRETAKAARGAAAGAKAPIATTGTDTGKTKRVAVPLAGAAAPVSPLSSEAGQAQPGKTSKRSGARAKKGAKSR